MKRFTFILLAFFFFIALWPIPNLAFNQGCPDKATGALSGGGCSKGSTIFGEDFESGFSDGNEMDGINSWSEVSPSTNIFTATSTSIHGSMSGYIDNAGAGSDNNYIERVHTELLTGTHDYVTWRAYFKCADTTGTNQTNGMFLFSSDDSADTTTNRVCGFSIYNDKLWYLDNATWQDIGNLTDTTTFKLEFEVNIDASGDTDCVRIWLDDTEITYVASRSGYQPRAQKNPTGTDRITLRNDNSSSSFGDITGDSILIYNGQRCVTGDP